MAACPFWWRPSRGARHGWGFPRLEGQARRALARATAMDTGHPRRGWMPPFGGVAGGAGLGRGVEPGGGGGPRNGRRRPMCRVTHGRPSIAVPTRKVGQSKDRAPAFRRCARPQGRRSDALDGDDRPLDATLGRSAGGTRGDRVTHREWHGRAARRRAAPDRWAAPRAISGDRPRPGFPRGRRRTRRAHARPRLDGLAPRPTRRVAAVAPDGGQHPDQLPPPHVRRLGTRPRLPLQRRLRPHPRRQAPRPHSAGPSAACGRRYGPTSTRSSRGRWGATPPGPTTSVS